MSGVQTARFSAALAFFTAVWVTCVNRADPKIFFSGGRGISESLRVSDYNFTISNSGLPPPKK